MEKILCIVLIGIMGILRSQTLISEPYFSVGPDEMYV